MAFARHMVCNWSYFAGSMDHVYNGKYSYHVCIGSAKQGIYAGSAGFWFLQVGEQA